MYRLARVPLPETVRDAAVRQLDRYCDRREADDRRLEYVIRGDAITLVERRPPWRPMRGAEWTSSNVAQFRFDETARTWSLFWPRPTGQWMEYDGVRPGARARVAAARGRPDPPGVFSA